MPSFKVTYTNKDIMDKLESLGRSIDGVRLKVVETNSKVKIHEKMLYALFSAVIIIVGWLIFL